MPRSISFPDLGRTVTVGDDVTDDGIDQVYGELSRQQSRAKQGVLRAEGMAAQTRADVLDAYENDPEMPMLMRSELGRSVARGMANMGGSALSAASMAMGNNPELSGRKLNAYGKELSRIGDIESTAPASFSEVHDLSDFGGYAGRLLAEQIPQLMISGPVAGGLQAAGMGTKAAMMAAPVITTFPQEAGSIYQDITDQTGLDGPRQREVATAAGLVSAGFELGGGQARVLRNLFANGGVGNFRKFITGIGGEVLRGMRDEGRTEGTQQIVSSVAPYLAGGRLPTEQEFVDSVSEATIAGGLTGGPMGGVSKAVASVGDPGVYAAALKDAVSPAANQGGIYARRDQNGRVIRDEQGAMEAGVIGGINSNDGLQPYRGGRIEEANNQASKLNPNDYDSLKTSEVFANAQSGTPVDAQASLETRLLSRLGVDPQVVTYIQSISGILNGIENGYEVDQSIKDRILNQSEGISYYLGQIADSAVRRNDPTGGINVVLDVQKRLDRWASETTAFRNRNVEAEAEGRRARMLGQTLERQQSQVSDAAGALGQLEENRANQFGPGTRLIATPSFDLGSDIKQRLRQARLEDERSATQDSAALSRAAQSLSQLESNESQRFGPGARGEVREVLPTAGSDRSADRLKRRLQQARAEDERLFATAQAKADAKAQAQAQADAEDKAYAQAQAQADAEEKAYAQAQAQAATKAPSVQSQIDSLKLFMDNWDQESNSLPSVRAMKAFAKEALDLGHISQLGFNSAMQAHKLMGSQEDTTDAMDDIKVSLSFRMDELLRELKPINVAKARAATAKAKAAGMQFGFNTETTYLYEDKYDGIHLTPFPKKLEPYVKVMARYAAEADPFFKNKRAVTAYYTDSELSDVIESGEFVIEDGSALNEYIKSSIRKNRSIGLADEYGEDQLTESDLDAYLKSGNTVTAPTIKNQPKPKNANQVQRPAQESGSDESISGDEGAGREAGKIQAVPGTPQRQQPNGGAPSPTYADGSDVKVGDYVRVNKLVGQSKIYGSVFEIKDGVPIIKITTIGKGQSGTAQTDKAGVRLGDSVPLPSKRGVFLTKETNKNELAAQAKQEKEEQEKSVIDKEQELINQGAVDELYGEFERLMRRAQAKDEDAQLEVNGLIKELWKTPAGRIRAISIQAAVRHNNITNSIEKQLLKNGAFINNDNVAGSTYSTAIKNWIRKSLASEDPIKFVPSPIANSAIQNAIKQRLVDKNSVSISSDPNLEGSDSSPYQEIAAAETGAGAGNVPIGVVAAASTSSTNLLKQFARDKGRVQNLKAFVAKYIDQYGLAESIKKSVTKVFLQSVEKIDATTSDVIDQISDEAVEVLQKTFDEDGSVGVVENIGNGMLLDASTKSSDTGNQSLTTGELTLDQAINTVLETEPQGSLLRSLAEKLLKAGVTARVIVLSDEEFSQLNAKPGATAFYDSDPSNNTIYVRQSAQSHDYLVMHEAIHAATVFALRTNVAFRNDINRLRSQAIAALGSDSYGLQDYGSNFKNLSEFIAEALSNKDFQAALNAVKSGNQTLWQKFKALVSKIFRVSGSEKSLLDELIERTSDSFAPNVQTRVSPQDAAYLKAVESGDMETAQRMVDEAATAAGYTIGPVWHYTTEDSADFTRFDKTKAKLGAFFFSPENQNKSGRPDAKLKGRFYLSLKNPRTVTSAKSVGGVDNNLAYYSSEGLSSSGFDGLVGTEPSINGGRAVSEYVIFNPSQIKSADSVTRDDNGNVIPLSQRFNPKSDSILYAAPRIANDEKRQALLSVPGLSADSVRAIENLAATQAFMAPQSAITMLGAASRQTQRRMAWLNRQANASPNPASLGSLMNINPTYAEVEEFAEAAHGVDKMARDIERNQEKAEKRLAELQDKFNSIGSLKTELSTAQGNAAAIKAISESMLDDYESYIRNRANISGKLTVAQQASLTNASEVVRRVRKESNEMRKAMDTIASVVPEAVVNAATTNDDLITYIAANNVLDGKVDANTIAFLTTPGASGNTPLQSFKRLIPAVKLIQKIKADLSALDQSIDAYENAFAATAGNKVRKVTPSTFAKRFSKLDAKRAEILDEARLLNSQINRITRDVVSSQEEVDIYENIVNSPEYKDQVQIAIKQLNILTGGHREGGAEGNPTDRKLTFQIGSDPNNRFEINYSADPAENDKNKSTVLAALAAINAELHAATSPYEIFKLKWMQMKLIRYGHQMTDASLGINPFDIVNRVRVMTPFLRPLIDRMFIFRQIPGAMGSMARILAKVGMSMSSQIEAAKKHPAYGEAAINAAVQKAINSHGGMDPQVWDKEVLNELLGANQERTGRNIRAGETTIFGHKITPEDVSAADLQARFADSMYRVAKGAERGGIAMHFPTLVQETYTVNGEKRIRFRYAYAGGALTTPRSYDRSELSDAPVAMSLEWIEAEVANDPAATQAAREALLQDPNFLTRFAVAHVAEMNPEYDRKSAYNAIYLALADHYAKTGSYPKTFDQLVDDIDNRLPLPAPATRSSEIKAQLIKEITAFTEAYRNDLIGAAANDRDANLRTDALSSGAVGEITSASNNFTKPRGKMIAPTNFHTYTLSSDSSRGSIAHGVMLPLRRRQQESMQNILKALEASQQEMLKELKKVKNPRDYFFMRFGEGKRRVTAKQAYVTYGQLTDLVNQMSTSLEVFQTMLSKPVIGSGQTSFFEDALQLRRVGLVAQITSATMNYVQAVLSGQFVPRSFLGGEKPRALITQSAIGIATGAFSTAAYLASNNKAASSWLKANKGTVIPVLKQFAELVDQIQKMKARARLEGFGAAELSLSEQSEIIRNVGSFNSPVEGFNDSQNYISSQLGKLFSKWWLPNVALFIQNIPASADRTANIITMIQIDRAMNDVVRSGYSIMENRSKTGASGWDNWTDPNNSISEDEAAQAGWSRETLIRMRQAFSGMGGVEPVLHDYWKRVNAAKAAGQNINEVSPIADEGFYMDVTREVLGLSNAAMDSMRPDATRSRTAMSKIYNFVFTFTSWVNGWFSGLGTNVAVDRTRGYTSTAAVSALSMALLAVLLATSGMWANEIRGLMYELIKGRPYSVIRLGDVARDMRPETVAKLLGASAALMVPYAGEAIASLVGAQNYRSSLTDIAKLSQPIQLVNTFWDALMNGARTGDWTGTFLQTLRSVVPGSDMVINRIPAVAARDATNDAGRVARVAAGPLELSERSGGSGAQPTRFSSLIKRAEGELANGNQAKAQSLLNEAANEKVKQGNTDPWGAVKSAIQGRDVDQRTFGRKINEDERNGLMSRMGSSQREVYSRAKNNLANLKNLVPEKGSRGALERVSSSGQSSRPETAIDRLNKRVNKLRKGVRPKGLIAINKKIKSLKPKKIRFAKVKSATGTRLLQPKARVKGASALLPSV